MLLEYLALGILVVGVIVAIYVFLFIHDIPYQIAKKRNHPQAEAIHVACWLSLFTLNALWPIVYMWSVSNIRPLSIKVSGNEGLEGSGEDNDDIRASLDTLRKQVAQLEQKLDEAQS